MDKKVDVAAKESNIYFLPIIPLEKRAKYNTKWPIGFLVDKGWAKAPASFSYISQFPR
ncbi:hypothetical protein HMPREF0083_03690 [Aneurinibacillus aneurinilyticus ATCC 12856]|uniref:Uncharacterized protein n=1 Tax=Aneurinibacillus aneurinilyticus ATCC 12856 TaxID=649747 RepID=U1WZR0_ANEAE|nr:hypothetical protein HMPREF0083_03690 [Aneurinibacillus aneurinilyticus ATCC 12856]